MRSAPCTCNLMLLSRSKSCMQRPVPSSHSCDRSPFHMSLSRWQAVHTQCTFGRLIEHVLHAEQCVRQPLPLCQLLLLQLQNQPAQFHCTPAASAPTVVPRADLPARRIKCDTMDTLLLLSLSLLLKYVSTVVDITALVMTTVANRRTCCFSTNVARQDQPVRRRRLLAPPSRCHA